jgi:hypothetical protein
LNNNADESTPCFENYKKETSETDIAYHKYPNNWYHAAYTGKGKGKATPLQAWTDPEGSSSLILLD